MSGTGTSEGQGFTVSSAVLAIVLNYVDCNISGPTVGVINCSDQSTTNFEEKIAMTLKDGGQYAFTCNHNLLDQAALLAAIGVTDNWTVTWPKSASANTAATDVIPGFIIGTPKTIGKGDLMKVIVTIEVSGTPVLTSELVP